MRLELGQTVRACTDAGACGAWIGGGGRAGGADHRAQPELIVRATANTL